MIEALLVLFLLATLAAGAALAAGFDRAVPILWGARPAGVITALNEGAALILRPVVRTEAPDRLTGVLAPASYLALSFIGLLAYFGLLRAPCKPPPREWERSCACGLAARKGVTQGESSKAPPWPRPARHLRVTSEPHHR